MLTIHILTNYEIDRFLKEVEMGLFCSVLYPTTASKLNFVTTKLH